MNELMLLLFSHIDSTCCSNKTKWRTWQVWQVRHMLICPWYDGILTSVWSLRKADTQTTACFKWDFQWLRQSFGKIFIDLLYHYMSEHFFRYCFLWFMTSEPFIFKSSLTAIQIWLLWKLNKNDCEYGETSTVRFFLYSHILHSSIQRLYTS